VKKTSLHSCNVLEAGPAVRRVWQFHTTGGDIRPGAEIKTVPPQPLPPRAVGKDWHSLWQKKLNIAWMPPTQIFLRVLHLPVVDRTELVSMVEFQLEKVSPLPVAQIVWTIEVLPPAENIQPVIVLLAARDKVAQFLGEIEEDGFLADRLEFPLLHVLLNAPPSEDGIWIYAQAESEHHLALVAWWVSGTLQNLQLLTVPASDPAAHWLVEELNKIAWAGELEGWVPGPLPIHLTAPPEVATAWQPGLLQWSGQPVVLHETLSKTALAEISARRAVREVSQANLLPAEETARYRQIFIDRLWMRGIAAVFVIYMVGVAAYFGLLQYWKFKQSRLEGAVAVMSGSYTNAIQLKERVQVLQDQLNLKYAALDCWKAASELLPADLSLTSLEYSRDKLNLRGTAAQEDSSQVLAYSQKLVKAIANGQALFSKVDPPTETVRGNPPRLDWSFSCTLNLPKVE